MILYTKAKEKYDYVLKGEIPHKFENKRNEQASYLSVMTPVTF